MPCRSIRVDAGVYGLPDRSRMRSTGNIKLVQRVSYRGVSDVVHVDGVRGALLTRALGNDGHGRGRRPMIFVA